MDIDFDHRRSWSSHRRRSGWRGRHRHLFAWGVLGGAAVLGVLAILGALAALGLGGVIGSAYFAIAEAVLPAAWHDELHALPGIAHVAIVAVVIALAAGVLGELLD